MPPQIRRPVAVLALLLGSLFLIVPSAQAVASGPPAQRPAAPSLLQADPTPSPSLGATQAPSPDLPDDNDQDAADWSASIWVLLVPLALVVIIGASVYAFFRTRRREQAGQQPRDR
jgi:hypothetical protein